MSRFSHVADASRTSISMYKLKKWHAKLEEVRALCDDIESLPIERAVKERVKRRLGRIGEVGWGVEGDVAEKIEGRG